MSGKKGTASHMQVAKLLTLLAATLVASLLVCRAYPQGTGHYNIIGRAVLGPGGHGEIRCDGGGQEAQALELDVTGGPANITRVVIHFADSKLKPWASAISPRTTPQWTSRPIKWPSGKAHKVTFIEYWYSGPTGKSPNIALLGLQ